MVQLAKLLLALLWQPLWQPSWASGTTPGFPPSLKPGCLATDANNTDLFCPGDLDYGCYKIPTILRTARGTLLAMIEARKHSCDDHGFVDLRVRRSVAMRARRCRPPLPFAGPPGC